MSDDSKMTEMELLRHVLSRPGVYIGNASVETLVAFFSGYDMACWIRGIEPPLWDEILAQIPAAVAPDLAADSLSLDRILERVCGGDKKTAFDLLVQEIKKRLPPTS